MVCSIFLYTPLRQHHSIYFLQQKTVHPYLFPVDLITARDLLVQLFCLLSQHKIQYSTRADQAQSAVIKSPRIWKDLFL